MPKGNPGATAQALMHSHIQKLVFDVMSIALLIIYHYHIVNHLHFKAALWDWAYGGATLVIHIEGAMCPNLPHIPEYMKADVYFLCHLINEDPHYSPILSHMDQQYIADIGLLVVEWWEICAGAMWSLTQGRNAPNYPCFYP